MHNLLEVQIFTLRNFTKLPILIYLDICNVLHIWHIQAIPTYRVNRLYDYKARDPEGTARGGGALSSIMHARAYHVTSDMYPDWSISYRLLTSEECKQTVATLHTEDHTVYM